MHARVFKESLNVGFTPNQDDGFIGKGFDGWNHGPERVKTHTKSKMHKKACVRLSRVHGTEDTNIGMRAEIPNLASAEQKENQQFLWLMFLTIRIGAGQGLALRGKQEESSNFVNVLEAMMEGAGKNFSLYKNKHEYCSWAIHNEIIEMFCRHTMRNVVKWMSDCREFCAMEGEGSDTSNAELLSSSIRQHDERS